MRTLRMLIASLTLATVVGATQAGPVAAQATDLCTASVYAENSTLDVDDPELLSVVADLEAEGFDVHALVINTYNGSPENWVENRRLECPNWSNEAGDDIGIRTLVISIATQDRVLNTRLGSALRLDITERDDERIREDVMVSALAATQGEDTTPAMINGLRSIYNFVTAPDPGLQPETSTNPNPSNSTSSNDDSNAGVIMLILLGVIVAIGLLFFLGYLISGWLADRRQRREEYEAAKANAETSMHTMRTKVGDDVLQELGRDIEGLKGSLALADEHEVSGLTSGIDALTTSFNQLSADYLAVSLAEEPKTTPAWHSRETEVRRIVDEHERIKQSFFSLRSQVADYNAIMNGAKPKLDAMHTRVDGVAGLIDTHKEAGLNTAHIQPAFDEVVGNLSAAEEAFRDGRFRASMELLQLATEGLPPVRKEVNTLPKLAQSLRGKREALSERLGRLRAFAAETHVVFDEMVAEFGEANIDEIRGFGSEAEALLAEVEQQLPGIDELVSDDVQDYAGARDLVANAGLLLEEARTELQEVHDLRVELHEARSKAPRVGERVANKLEDGLTYCRSKQSDAGDDEIRALEALREPLAALRSELTSPQANHRGMIDRLRVIERQIAAQVKSAEIDYREAERLRRELDEIRREALDSIDKASRYTKKHGRDVRRSTRDELEDAVRRSGQDTSGMSVAEAIIFWTLIDETVDSAHSSAKSNVRSAKSARRSSYTSSRSSSSSSSYGSSSSFGGSSGFGSFGSFGGSSSFGGGGGGSFGGSSSW